MKWIIEVNDGGAFELSGLPQTGRIDILQNGAVVSYVVEEQEKIGHRWESPKGDHFLYMMNAANGAILDYLKAQVAAGKSQFTAVVEDRGKLEELITVWAVDIEDARAAIIVAMLNINPDYGFGKLAMHARWVAGGRAVERKKWMIEDE